MDKLNLMFASNGPGTRWNENKHQRHPGMAGSTSVKLPCKGAAPIESMRDQVDPEAFTPLAVARFYMEWSIPPNRVQK